MWITIPIISASMASVYRSHSEGQQLIGNFLLITIMMLRDLARGWFTFSVLLGKAPFAVIRSCWQSFMSSQQDSIGWLFRSERLKPVFQNLKVSFDPSDHSHWLIRVLWANLTCQFWTCTGGWYFISRRGSKTEMVAGSIQEIEHWESKWIPNNIYFAPKLSSNVKGFKRWSKSLANYSFRIHHSTCIPTFSIYGRCNTLYYI